MIVSLIVEFGMPGEMEVSSVYQDLEVEEKENKIPEKKVKNMWKKRWLVPVVFVAGVFFAAVCFGVGFAIAYFAVPDAGR